MDPLHILRLELINAALTVLWDGAIYHQA